MSRKPKLTDLDPTVVSEVFTRRVAILAIAGKTSAEIGKDMGLTSAQIGAIQRGDGYKKLVERMGEQEMLFAVSQGKTRMAGMVNDAADVIRKVMKDYLNDKGSARDAIVAAQTVNRSVGVDKEGDKQNDTNITIQFPAGIEPMTFEAEKVPNDSD